jgi:uroporphyrinogen-III synthase
MRLLVTRPEEDGAQLAERLRALGHEPVLLPLLDVTFPPLDALRLDGVQALIATSRNALRALARNEAFHAAKTLPVYCVGDATAALAEEMGFRQIHAGPGNAKELAPVIARTAKPGAGPLLYLTGEHIAFDLAAVLSALRFTVRREIVYRAETTDAAPLLATHFAAGLDGVVLMSPRTAQIFAAFFKTLPAGDIRALTCYCYSPAVAKPLMEQEERGLSGLRLFVAERPTEADLLSLIGAA